MSEYDNNPPLSQHIILVTGASDGIGKQAALSYARHGAEVILLGRDAVKLAAVAEKIAQSGGKPARVIVLDLATATPAACQKVATALADSVPKLNGVLHNAGILGEIAPISSLEPQIWSNVMQVNLHSTFYLTQALLPLLLMVSDSSLIFTSSGVGRQGRAGWGAYAVSKFATEGLMQVLADEYPAQQLRVNCINPGKTRTAMRALAAPDEDPGTLHTAADIMPLYLWLMSDASRGISGESFDAGTFTPPGAQ